MFDKIKQLKKARDIQSALKEEEVTVEKEGTLISMDATLKIKKIKINPELEKEKQEAVLIDCINEAMLKVQTIAVKEMSKLGGFGL